MVLGGGAVSHEQGAPVLCRTHHRRLAEIISDLTDFPYGSVLGGDRPSWTLAEDPSVSTCTLIRERFFFEKSGNETSWSIRVELLV